MKTFMPKYRLTCPECGAAIITLSPEAAVWEICPSCRRHVWDLYDVMMADNVPGESQGRHGIAALRTDS